MGYDLIIRNGTVVTAADTFKGDVGVVGGKVAALGRKLKHSAVREIDARGRILLPGGIDAHVHLQLLAAGTVTSDDFETGTRAAACGGVTTVIDFANQAAGGGLVAGVEDRMEEAEGKVCVDYSLHCCITDFRRMRRPAQELKKLMESGVPSVKLFMSYASRGMQSDDGDIFETLECAKEIGSTVMVHAESGALLDRLVRRYRRRRRELGAWAHVLSRPNVVEEEAVMRALKWGEAAGGHLYIVHMSTGEAAGHLKAAQAAGVNAHGETCPQYLVLCDDVFRDKRNGHLYATCPQIKKKKDSDRLWRALADGELALVATDTCTFTAKQKAAWNGDFTKIPCGLPGTETMIPILYTQGYKAGRFSLNHLVSLVSTNPAKLMGMYPQKGTIAPGSDADFIVIDPKVSRKVDWKRMETECDWSPYQGMRLYGFPEYTVSRGEVIVEKGAFTGRPGRGRFVKRKGYGWRQLSAPWAVR